MDDTDEPDRTPFEQCPECGTPVVHLGGHTCGTEASDQKPRQAARLAAAASDSRPGTETVVLVPSNDAYTYHECGGDGTPACGGPGAARPDDYIIVTRDTAHARGRAPCQSCASLGDGIADCSDTTR